MARALALAAQAARTSKPQSDGRSGARCATAALSAKAFTLMTAYATPKSSPWRPPEKMRAVLRSTLISNLAATRDAPAPARVR